MPCVTRAYAVCMVRIVFPVGRPNSLVKLVRLVQMFTSLCATLDYLVVDVDSSPRKRCKRLSLRFFYIIVAFVFLFLFSRSLLFVYLINLAHGIISQQN